MNSTHDLIIIGGGPGGYVCAIRAAQLGMQVALIESRPSLGGTCVNVGCIPSKTLLDSSHKYHESQGELADHGIELGPVRLDLKKMMARKDKVIRELTDGLDHLIKKNKIQRWQGKGRFQKVSDGKVYIQVDAENPQVLLARHCVIATGSESISLPGMAVDGKAIINSDHAIALRSVPKKLAIIGGGVIGLELGSVWKRLGSEVTIIEAMSSILTGMDKQMHDLALRILSKQGLQFLLGHTVSQVQTKDKGVQITAENTDGHSLKLEADKLLVSVGRRPYTEGLDLEKIGVRINRRGRIEVDPQSLETHRPGVYAIGDVIEGAMLAHRAEEEGIMVAERIAAQPGHVNYKTLPWIVYTWPEIAWVGHSEKLLKDDRIRYNVGRYLFKSNGRAKAMNETQGQVKILADAHNDRILGVHIIGPNASELIAEAALAMEFGASAEDIARSSHAHPTLSEVLREAALDVAKRSLHA